MKVVFSSIIAGYTINLLQYGYDNFTVVYGEERTTNVSYSNAARVLGECLMHALACEGKLNVENN